VEILSNASDKPLMAVLRSLAPMVSATGVRSSRREEETFVKETRLPEQTLRFDRSIFSAQQGNLALQ